MSNTTKPARSPRPAAPRASRADGESAVLGAIAAMPAPYRAIGERLHAIIRTAAPELSPRLWYGMPAYARGGKVICFFRGADKFKERYMTLGFNDPARLDSGNMWPVAFALSGLSAVEEAAVAALVKKAVGQSPGRPFSPGGLSTVVRARPR